MSSFALSTSLHKVKIITSFFYKENEGFNAQIDSVWHDYGDYFARNFTRGT